MSESGTVLGVVEETLSTQLAVSAIAGDTTLYVQDVAYFAPLGGQLLITDGTNEEAELTYTGIDEPTQTIVGLDGLLNAYDYEDALVQVYPAVRTRYAEVRLDGQSDTIRVRVPFSMFDQIADGFYADGAGEVLRVLVSLEDEYVIDDVLGTVPEVALDNLSVLDNLLVEGEFRVGSAGEVFIESGVPVELAGQLSAPTVAPTMTQDWDYIDNYGPISVGGEYYSTLQHDDRRGAYWDTSDQHLYFCGASTLKVAELDDEGFYLGAAVAATSNYFYGSITKVGTDFYVLAWYAPTDTMYVRKYDSAWTYVSEFAVATNALPGVQALSDDGTDLWIAEIIASGGNAGKARFRRYSTAGVLQETLTSSTTTSTSGIVKGYQARAADFGVETHAVILSSNDTRIRHYSAAGVYDGLRVDNPCDDECAGLLWDGTNFRVLGNGANIAGVASSELYTLSGNYWTSSTVTHWITHTWYDNDAAGTGSHETTRSDVRSFTGRRRKRWNWNVAATIDDNGGDDDPNAVNIYIGRGTTQPADAAMWLQTSGVTGEQSGEVIALVSAGTALPAANNFPDTDPAELYSKSAGSGVDTAGEGEGWVLSGDGSTAGFTDVQTFTTPGSATWTKPMSGALSTAEIVLIGGGGGGGSGKRNTGGNAVGGGGGGGGGSIVRCVVPLSLLNGSETVVVGAGGAGGNGRTTNIDGQAGSDGIDSTMTVGGVASFLIAKRGSGGAAGTSSGGTGGSSVGSGSFQELLGSSGGDGGVGVTGANADATPSIVTTNFRQGASGGGGGGGVNSGGTAGQGGTGGRCYDLAAAAGGVTSTDPGPGLTKLLGLAFPGGGGGGSGGRPGTSTTKVGGAGGKYGGGGGGSGGGQTVDSGTGGAGAQGIVVVICR